MAERRGIVVAAGLAASLCAAALGAAGLGVAAVDAATEEPVLIAASGLVQGRDETGAPYRRAHEGARRRNPGAAAP